MASKHGADTEVKEKRKRSVMTLEQKIKVLDYLAKGASAASIGRILNVNESTIRSIKKNEVLIRASVARGTSTSAKVSYMPRDRNLEKTEKMLKIWMEEQTEKNELLSASVICAEARRLYDQCASETRNMGIEPKYVKKFQASKGWFEKFKKRYLHNINLVKDSESTDFAASISFQKDIASKLESDEPSDAHSDNVVEFLECDLQESTGNGLENFIYSSYNEDNEVKNSLTLNKVNAGLSMADQLADYFISIDPHIERGENFKRGLEALLWPYREIQKDLKMGQSSVLPT